MPAVDYDLIQEERLIEVTGKRLLTRRLYHRRPLTDGRPVLVFLHEGLGSIDLWGDFPAQMAHLTGLEALLYDRLGHGGSDPLVAPGKDLTYQEPEAYQYLPGVLTQTAVRRCVLIGHSDGGTLALMYTAACPQNVAAIVTMAAHVYVDQVTLTGIRRTIGVLQAGSRLGSKLAAAHGASKAAALIERWSTTWLAPDFAGWNIVAGLDRIHCPVLVLQGADDEYGLPAQAQCIAQEVSGPSELYLIPDCRHVPHIQAREAVVEHILGFFRQHHLC